jgi:hypothetical protein
MRPDRVCLADVPEGSRCAVRQKASKRISLQGVGKHAFYILLFGVR